MDSKETIYDVIMNDNTLRNYMIAYLKRLIDFCYGMHCGRHGATNIEAFMKNFEPPNYRYSGAISAEALYNQLNNGTIDLNMREIMLAIMQYSFRVSPYLWDLIIMVEGDDLSTVGSILEACGIKGDILIKRIKSIQERFAIEHTTMFTLQDSKKKKYVNKSAPAPTWQHAVTESLKYQDNLTVKMKKMFPRMPANDFIYGQILEGYEPRVRTKYLPHQELSAREKEFIDSRLSTLPNFFGLFVENGEKDVLPWQCGYLGARIHPDHYYASLAKHFKRYSFIGPSGTTEVMMNVAEIFGVNMKQMAGACIGWMYSVLDHTLFELMIVINMFFDEPEPIFKFDTSHDNYDKALKKDNNQVVDFCKENGIGGDKIDKIEAAMWHEQKLFPDNRSLLDIINIPPIKAGNPQEGGRCAFVEAKNIIKQLNECITCPDSPDEAACKEKCDFNELKDKIGKSGCVMEDTRIEDIRLENMDEAVIDKDEIKDKFSSTTTTQATVFKLDSEKETTAYYKALPSVELSFFEEDVPSHIREIDDVVYENETDKIDNIAQFMENFNRRVPAPWTKSQ